MAQLTEFGKKIKVALIERGQTQNWLIEEMRKDTGMYVDTSALHRIMTGKLNSSRLTASIRKILVLPDEQKGGETRGANADN